MPTNLMQQTITNTLEVVMLTEHAQKRVVHLSGGMKRKLSLAMAIVTKPKVIILDEPTSGLDIESRRQVWELIKRIKVGRSIIMSSQHLEEADELADRICIMTKGQLLALDKPEQIKKQFGVGYKLLIEPRTDKISLQDFMNTKTSSIDPFMLSTEGLSHGVTENSDSTMKKLIYQLPLESVAYMSRLLAQLEQQFGEIANIDVEVNSLEDAYINIAKEEEKLLANLEKDGFRRFSQTSTNNRGDSKRNSINAPKVTDKQYNALEDFKIQEENYQKNL